MEESDYRILMGKLEAYQAESAALRRVLDTERSSFDVYIQNIQTERARRAEVDAIKNRNIERLELKVDSMRKRQYWPGIIMGCGVGTDGHGAQGIIGLGWKFGW